jgi:hypothetical protein
MISRLLVTAASAVLLASCTTYHVDFAKAVQALPVPPDSPTGPWKGRWVSQANGHEGALWCVVTQGPNDTYDFRYRAGWAKFQFGDYTHTCPVETGDDGSLKIAADMKLPGEWGTYTVKGTITPTEFDATYTSDTGDRGTMKLRRP